MINHKLNHFCICFWQRWAVTTITFAFQKGDEIKILQKRENRVIQIPGPESFEPSTTPAFYWMDRGVITLITLLRIPYLCHFGSTSFVLPIWPKYCILNRVIRVVWLVAEPKYLVTTEIQMSAIFGPNSMLPKQLGFVWLKLLWAFLVRGCSDPF